jgi:signal transduction histidine kinase
LSLTEDPLQDGEAIGPHPPPASWKPLKARVLIVDDDERNAFAASEALEDLGHELVVARSGEEALRKLLDDDFAVILLDLHMPGMDGYETAALIRQRKRTRDTPIVFVTAVYRDEAHLFQAYSAGAVDVVFKPVDPFILRSKVQVLVDLHLKTCEVERQSEYRRWLLDENARVRQEKAAAERLLAQAQKMEAVGQLTGGIAHDFNNLLTVVLGNIDLLSRRADDDPRQQRQLAAIRYAAERGRDLTHQLLAFSRRQHLNPIAVDAVGLVRNFTSLLQQAVGEAVTVHVDLPETPVCAHVDPAQLETALLNLAVNARDAMPEGGEVSLKIHAAEAADTLLRREHPDASSGPWICVEVTDTGIGMDAEVVERVFEPFFTTKEVGKGSGLGLSQVYGFVRQSEGHVTIESRPGHGATIRLFLRASSEAAAQPAGEAGPCEVTRGEGEHVLVVEDDDRVLALAVETLSELGYKVSTAADAPSALELLQGGQPLDVLFTDVVMPGGMSGVQLAEAAIELRPKLSVLLTSGYLGSAAASTKTGFHLIDKPYDRAALSMKLREVLSGAPPARTNRAGRVDEAADGPAASVSRRGARARA